MHTRNLVSALTLILVVAGLLGCSCDSSKGKGQKRASTRKMTPQEAKRRVMEKLDSEQVEKLVPVDEDEVIMEEKEWALPTTEGVRERTVFTGTTRKFGVRIDRGRKVVVEYKVKDETTGQAAVRKAETTSMTGEVFRVSPPWNVTEVKVKLPRNASSASGLFCFPSTN